MPPSGQPYLDKPEPPWFPDDKGFGAGKLSLFLLQGCYTGKIV